MIYPILKLPTELLENILLCVDTAKDLLHLAQTCKFLSELIIPDHLNFIDIWSPVHERNKAVWRTLKTYPNLAKRTLKLHVIYEAERIATGPAGCAPGLHYVCDNRMHMKRYVAPGSSSDEEPHALFNAALRHMGNLLYFSLRHSMLGTQFREALTSISAHCSQLRGLHISMSHEKLGQEISLQTLSFPCLTSFALISCWGTCTICSAVFTRVVFGAPSLINICVVSKQIHRFVCPEFFVHGTWPNLRRLSCDGYFNFYPSNIQDDISKVNIAVSFFQRHPLLECLYIDDSHSPPLLKAGTFLRRSAFPSLRSLHLSSLNSNACMLQLHHISNIELFHSSTYKQLVSLRSCSLTTNDIKIVASLVNAVPGLERLDLYYFISGGWNCPRGVSSHSYPEQCLCDKQDVRTIISRLKNLTYLVLRLPEYFGTRDPQDFSDLVRALPKLQYLHLDVPYLVQRVADESIAYRLLQPSVHDLHHPQNWGDFFYGSSNRWGF